MTSAFAPLGLSEKLCETVARLGFEEPTPIQSAAVPELIKGGDVLGQAATGTGKTAAFALPAVEVFAGTEAKPGAPRVLVLTPTRELCLQVSESFVNLGQDSGLETCPIYGGQDYTRQIRLLKRGVHVVVATPGRALDHLHRGTLDLSQVQFFVMDEADEMLDMGFAEELEELTAALPETHQEFLTAIIIVSIMLTPILVAIFDFLRRRGWILSRYPMRTIADIDSSVKPAVVICGFGRVGQIVAQMLESQKIPYVALDLDVNAVMLGRERGFNVVYGNTKNEAVLRDFGVAPRRTRAVVIALDNVATARDTILTVRQIAPRAKIFARARNLADTQELLKLGVTQALPETIESSFLLGTGVLEYLGVSAGKIDNLLTYLRSDNYSGVEQTIADRG